MKPIASFVNLARGPRSLFWLIVVAMLAPGCGVAEHPADRIEISEITPSLVLAGEELYKPASVGFGTHGGIFVLDAGNYRIYEYTAVGSLVREFGRAGEGPAELQYLSSARIEVRGDRAVVASPGLQRVQIWNLGDETAYVLRVAGSPTGMVLNDKSLTLALAQVADGTPHAALFRYDFEGELESAYGEPFREGWDSPDEPRLLRNWTHSLIAGGPDGRVYQAWLWWPEVRAYSADRLSWRHWFDFEWIGDDLVRNAFVRPPTLVATAAAAARQGNLVSAAGLPGDLRKLRAPVVLGIAAASDRLFALMNGSFLQIYDQDGAPVAIYRLLSVDAPRAGRQAQVFGTQIAARDDGGRICVPEPNLARVVCWDLPRPG